MLATTAPATNLNGTTLEQLRAAADQLRREFPNAGARLDHAAFLVMAREIERGASAGTWWVPSEDDPIQSYLVLNRRGEAPHCMCQDWARRGALVGTCKHLAAVTLIERLERAEADAGTPPPTCRDCGQIAKLSSEGRCPRCNNILVFGPMEED